MDLGALFNHSSIMQRSVFPMTYPIPLCLRQGTLSARGNYRSLRPWFPSFTFV